MKIMGMNSKDAIAYTEEAYEVVVEVGVSDVAFLEDVTAAAADVLGVGFVEDLVFEMLLVVFLLSSRECHNPNPKADTARCALRIQQPPWLSLANSKHAVPR